MASRLESVEEPQGRRLPGHRRGMLRHPAVLDAAREQPPPPHSRSEEDESVAENVLQDAVHVGGVERADKVHRRRPFRRDALYCTMVGQWNNRDSRHQQTRGRIQQHRLRREEARGTGTHGACRSSGSGRPWQRSRGGCDLGPCSSPGGAAARSLPAAPGPSPRSLLRRPAAHCWCAAPLVRRRQKPPPPQVCRKDACIAGDEHSAERRRPPGGAASEGGGREFSCTSPNWLQSTCCCCMPVHSPQSARICSSLALQMLGLHDGGDARARLVLRKRKWQRSCAPAVSAASRPS